MCYFELSIMTDKNEISAAQRFEDFLRSHKKRLTPERFKILDVALAMGQHFGAEELYRKLEENAFHVSRVTVYSTLALLCEAGILSDESFGKRKKQYERNQRNHIHLICRNCGKIREVHDPEIMHQLSLRRYGSFSPQKVSIEIFGLCGNCARKSRKLIKSNKNSR